MFVGSNASSWYVTYMWSTIKNTLLIIFPELSFEKKFIPKISLKNLEKWIFRRKNKKNQKWAFEYLIIKIHFSRFFNEILGINFFLHDNSKKIIKILGFFFAKKLQMAMRGPLKVGGGPMKTLSKLSPTLQRTLFIWLMIYPNSGKHCEAMTTISPTLLYMGFGLYPTLLKVSDSYTVNRVNW